MEEKKPSIVARGKSVWDGLNKTLRISIIAVLVALLAVIVYLIVAAGRVEYEVLQMGLSPEEAAEATAILSELEIPYTVQGVNSITINVPKGTRTEVLLQMQSEGYPASEEALYNIYIDHAGGMGTTDQDKQMYTQFQKEQYISYQLELMDKIEDASVTINLGKTSQFALSESNQPASASVVLTLEKGEALTDSEAEAVRSMVVTGVPGMLAENVTILDSNMRMYRLQNSEDAAAGVYAADQIALKQQHQQLIQEQVYNFLNPVFGVGNVTASVAVELDFDKKSTQSITFSPPGDEDNMGIIVSLQQSAERAGVDELAEGVAGFDSNGAAPFYPEDLEGDTAPVYSYSQQLNAEVNEVREQIEEAQGKVTGLSVSVMVDADEAWDEELENVRNLVANGLGVDPEYVVIMRTSFKANEEYQQMLAEQEAAEQALAEAQEQSERTTLLVIAGAVALVLLVVIVMVAVSARKRRAAYEAELARIEEERQLEAQRIQEEESLRERLGDNADPAAANHLKEIQKLAKEKPELVAQLLRNWLSTDSY